MTVDYENVGVNPEIVSSLLFQIYLMGRYRDTGEDRVVLEPDPDDDPEINNSDYYVGFVGGSSDDFRRMTKKQLFNYVLNKDGSNIDEDPVYRGTWNNNTLFVILREDITIDEAKFVSIAGGGEQILELDMYPPHADIEINEKKYKVLSRRLGVYNLGEDTYELVFNVM